MACVYPNCDCSVSFPLGHKPDPKTECPRGAPMVLTQEFTQNQIVAVLGIHLAKMYACDPSAFQAKFELMTDFKDDESGGLEFRAKITLTEIQS